MNKITDVTMKKAFDDLYKTFIIKNTNYGNSFEQSLNKYGIISALTRISDKFNRAENLILKKTKGTADEALTDTLLDMANYCIMTAIFLEGEENELHQDTDGLTQDGIGWQD